jgi:ribosomal protein L20
MSRVKRGTTKNKKRINVLKQVKGYRFGRSTKEAQLQKKLSTKQVLMLSLTEKTRRMTFENSGTSKIGAESTKEGLSYSKLISRF